MTDIGEDLEDLFENAPCGYLSLATDGRIVKVNATFCEWTGYSTHELIDRRLRDLLSVASRMFYETHFAPLLRMQGFFDEVALDVLTRDGKKLLMLANAREKRDADGQLTFTRVALFRAMERRRYERELVDAREMADAANRELSQGLSSERQAAELREQFIAVLGHDLRNPLASIDAGVRMLLRAEHDEKTVSVLNLMLATTRRMGVLIDHVLDFARGRLGGGLDFERQNLASLAPTLEQVIAEVRSSYPERHIDTELDLSVPIEADPARIGQLFSNLLTNAVTHGDPTRPVHVAAFVSNGRLEIAVSNSGEQILEAAMERLFQPFYRGRVKPHQQGLGLGLYIASQIAQAHGGRIDVESHADATRFTFRMPVSRERKNHIHIVVLAKEEKP